eukprot:TRINITY_DN15296_c0_g1_i1.p1 TRINITY_DN15296_c0_g1~~TRINITY_DN15296_c0_g1_i1.p1  ORF type:complete len:502 (-),score=125.61 TRINITY_DN15296_c0_g1_i1:43-1347(-)
MDPLVANSEVTGSIQECEIALDSLDSWVAPVSKAVPVVVKPGAGKIFKDPLGVICMISPWNYPCSIIMRPLIGAVAAGNCVLLKPSEVSEHTSEVMGRLILKYLDNKAIGVVQGGVDETSEVLKYKYDKILYTGNGFVGRIVMRAAAEHLTPVILELGGKSPLIIGPDVDMDKAVARISWGKFTNCGQTCIAPDYAFVHHTRYDEFIAKMKKQIKEFYGENPQESNDYAKIINSKHAARIKKLIDESKGTIACGGNADIEAAYVAPTIIENASFESSIMKDEIFGPVLPVFKLTNLDEAISFINDRPKPLALYVFSQDKKFVDKVLSETTSGGGCVNECLLHNMCKELPFGGVGESGMGAYNGKITFDEFTHHRGMLVRPQNSDLSIRFPPYTASKLQWLDRIDAATKVIVKSKKIILVGVLVLVSFIANKFLF